MSFKSLLGEFELFCVMDITKGFWNVPISPESRKYTAFTLRNIGLFEYLVMPNVTAPTLKVPNEGTLGAEKHLEALLDKLLEGGGVKVTPLVGFRLLSHPLSHLGLWQTPAY
jgi:hypothetical protein